MWECGIWKLGIFPIICIFGFFLPLCLWCYSSNFLRRPLEEIFLLIWCLPAEWQINSDTLSNICGLLRKPELYKWLLSRWILHRTLTKIQDSTCTISDSKKCVKFTNVNAWEYELLQSTKLIRKCIKLGKVFMHY